MAESGREKQRRNRIVSFRRSPTRSRYRKKPHRREHDVFGHKTIVYSLHVIFHFVGSRELLLAHGARKHFALVSFVVEERVPLEAVLVFERLLDVHFGALRALIHALVDGGVAEEVEPPDGHLRQLLGGVLALGGGAAARPTLHRLASRRRRRHGGPARRWGVVVQAVAGAQAGLLRRALARLLLGAQQLAGLRRIYNKQTSITEI
ncbi:hypothetical protein TcasGA2_TC013964 [Tribolium castaneum]|uniref:Uncharacterized protein n=1 Tax=Tribolium castaneum TaxID=7070 RepID=D6WNS7_TRICA|nr:hypothetical protein TcasGA2_TC013964 [Tribolium castaneum]